MILMYDLAARDAEMLALTLGDIDAKRLTVDLIGKGSKPRRLPITTETAAHCRRYTAAFHAVLDPAQPLFYTIHGHRKTPMSDDNVARLLRQHAAKARESCPEIPEKVHPHMLRHSRAMHLYQAGMPLALLTEWLGHADPETTLIYAHADTEMKRQALAKATGRNQHQSASRADLAQPRGHHPAPMRTHGVTPIIPTSTVTRVRLPTSQAHHTAGPRYRNNPRIGTIDEEVVHRQRRGDICRPTKANHGESTGCRGTCLRASGVSKDKNMDGPTRRLSELTILPCVDC